MSSLPVLHLKATSLQNMTITDDPYETTATLYTFLRSTPSVAEEEMAMQPFLEALHTAPSSGRAALLRKPNHRLVQLLSSVAIDDVFRRAPRVLPALARRSDTWLRRLGYEEGGAEDERQPSPASASRNKQMSDRTAAQLASSSSPSPSPPAPQLERHVVRAAEAHVYSDPYTAYEAQYKDNRNNDNAEAYEEHETFTDAAHLDTSEKPANTQNVAPQHASRSPRREAVEEHLQYSSSTQAPEDALAETARQPQRSYLSADVSALTPTDGTALDQDSQSDAHRQEWDTHKNGELNGRQEALPNGYDGPVYDAEDVGAGTLHPVLELITRQVEQAVAADQPSETQASASSSSAALDALVKDRILRLTSRLDDAAEEVSAAMYEKEERQEVWSPYYSRLKTSIAFVEALQQRLGSAISLYQLQRYERETLQHARIGVEMETLSLRLLLRDVAARVAEAEEAAAEASDADFELMARLRGVLNPSDEAAAQSLEED